ncbi:hypothetical protein SAMN05216556_1328 [Aequorivita viscosa]|uniref:Uncharacterized protein n=1 Tax=Aequorivita viscosa TaxID=797419 RepID=A0A1M6NDI3_9FLAO|nr:hypothetical protein SAMN05216556_1328 [Aequorivita viscosa]SHJ93666.1 hypothetical protein SAMN04487908_13323 [Aequorivita viscosa]
MALAKIQLLHLLELLTRDMKQKRKGNRRLRITEKEDQLIIRYLQLTIFQENQLTSFQ